MEDIHRSRVILRVISLIATGTITTDDTLVFEDTPAGLPIGGFMEFRTVLAGVVNEDVGIIFALPAFKNLGFKWRYKQVKSQIFSDGEAVIPGFRL
jgi:hypothetical protein